ncbi:MAG: hypothetical protein COB62_05305 [Piscirickettsiaceae bacterium]|nr:MAG: hypothetical protein COB62_05305 [Piscirickettsiaceae bacterium]
MSALTPKQQLDELLPYNLVATRRWLTSKGMTRHAIDNSLKSNRLKPLAVGVYARLETPLSWQSIVCSLQSMADHPIYVGGLTALDQQGLAQYLSATPVKTIHLYSDGKRPAWLDKIEGNVRFIWHGTKTLWAEGLFSVESFSREVGWQQGLPALKASCPEKAFLEMMVDVPNTVSFDHANEIMQGMTSLSPNKLESLLKNCKSIKAKRLFLWFAEKQRYAWFNKLDLADIDLGAGNRVIAKRGKLDKKYLITVPEHLYG